MLVAWVDGDRGLSSASVDDVYRAAIVPIGEPKPRQNH
jgi:hypothetical protein